LTVGKDQSRVNLGALLHRFVRSCFSREGFSSANHIRLDVELVGSCFFLKDSHPRARQPTGVRRSLPCWGLWCHTLETIITVVLRHKQIAHVAQDLHPYKVQVKPIHPNGFCNRIRLVQVQSLKTGGNFARNSAEEMPMRDQFCSQSPFRDGLTCHTATDVSFDCVVSPAG